MLTSFASGVTVNVGVELSMVAVASGALGVEVCVGAAVAGAAQAVSNRIKNRLWVRRGFVMISLSKDKSIIAII